MSKGNSVAGEEEEEEEEEEVLSGLQPINQNWYFCIIAVYPFFFFFHIVAVTTHTHTHTHFDKLSICLLFLAVDWSGVRKSDVPRGR